MLFYKYYFLSELRGVVPTDGFGLFGCTGSNFLRACTVPLIEVDMNTSGRRRV